MYISQGYFVQYLHFADFLEKFYCIRYFYRDRSYTYTKEKEARRTDINCITHYFPPFLSEAINLVGTEDMQEIRISAEKNCFVIKGGRVIDTGIRVSRCDIKKITDSICRGSMYAAQPSLIKGYITAAGGHRIGVCGRAITENGAVTHLTDISALCVRISREVIGAANAIMPYVISGGRPCSTLIISPPGCGKTTILRDIARQLGRSFKVCIADERSEIAAVKDGIAAHDVGALTCVMDAMPKGEAIPALLRTMSPQIIMTDETGTPEEEKAIYQLINCGAKIITTAHGYSEKDVSRRKYLGGLIDSGIFERIAVISDRKGPGTVERVIAEGRVVYHA